MADEMFFSAGERGLVRGRRAAARTETCRPCVLTLSDGREIQAVILNLNPHGLLVRFMEPLPVGTEVDVQMMRDETFTKPLSPPRRGRIVRLDATDGVFYDEGVRFEASRAPRRRERIASAARSPRIAITPREPSRMQTLDLTLGAARRRGR